MIGPQLNHIPKQIFTFTIHITREVYVNKVGTVHAHLLLNLFTRNYTLPYLACLLICCLQ